MDGHTIEADYLIRIALDASFGEVEVVHLQDGTKREKNGELIINQQDATFHRDLQGIRCSRSVAEMQDFADCYLWQKSESGAHGQAASLCSV